MELDELAEWVRSWAATYPDPQSEDAFLRGFAGRSGLTSGDLLEIVGWKFNTDARRRANATRRLNDEPAERILDLTIRAGRCNDDLGALLITCELAGVGPALGSTLLMCMRPDRYTVMDTRALASARALGFIEQGTRQASTRDWSPYLQACRNVSNATGQPLRTVDRALYRARGSSELPS